MRIARAFTSAVRRRAYGASRSPRSRAGGGGADERLARRREAVRIRAQAAAWSSPALSAPLLDPELPIDLSGYGGATNRILFREGNQDGLVLGHS